MHFSAIPRGTRIYIVKLISLFSNKIFIGFTNSFGVGKYIYKCLKRGTSHINSVLKGSNITLEGIV